MQTSGKEAQKTLRNIKDALPTGSQADSLVALNNLLKVFGRKGLRKETILTCFREVDKRNRSAKGEAEPMKKKEDGVEVFLATAARASLTAKKQPTSSPFNLNAPPDTIYKEICSKNGGTQSQLERRLLTGVLSKMVKNSTGQTNKEVVESLKPSRLSLKMFQSVI